MQFLGGYIKNSNMGCAPFFGDELKLETREEAQAACDKDDHCKSIYHPQCKSIGPGILGYYFNLCYTHSTHYPASDGSCIYQRSGKWFILTRVNGYIVRSTSFFNSLSFQENP